MADGHAPPPSAGRARGEPGYVSKYKPRPGRGLQTKVFALEDQMRQVQQSIDNVVSILHRIVPSAPADGTAGTATESGAAAGQQASRTSLGQADTDRSPVSAWQPLPAPAPAPSQGRPIHSLEQWVQTISSTSTPIAPSYPTHPTHHINTTSSTTTTARPPLPLHTSVSFGEDVGRSSSSSDEDIADGDEEEEGLVLMRDMLRREESARLRADGHALSPRDTAHSHPTLHLQQAPRHASITVTDSWTGAAAQHQPTQMQNKRKRSTFDEPMPRIRDGSISTSGNQAGVLGGKNGIPDPIELGLCTEEQGKELFRLFFKCAHTFMPVYDPSHDTWESLRNRSAFSTTSILYVGKKIQDAGQEASELQRHLKEHAENIGKTTLFSPISTIEALQAMIVLASWGDTGWRPGSHALSMALDMELHECLPRLAQLSTSSSWQANPDSSRALVVGARLWLLVSKMAIEMAYNHGRPLGLNEADVLPNAHALLNHPSALTTDSRTIASCELLLLRFPLHRLFLAKDTTNLDRALQVFNEGAGAWQARWQEYYLQRGVSQDDLLVTDLITQRCFGSVLANSRLLRDIRSAADVSDLPPHRRKWLESSLEDARLVVSHILSKEKDKLVHANHYSHVALASVSRIYLRLASLLPDQVDLRQIAKDLTQLADVLAHFPGFHFAQQLRRIIAEARKRRFLPPETRPSSPSSYPLDLLLNPLHPPHQQHQASSQTQQPTGDEHTFVQQNSNSGTGTGTGTSQSPFDFDVFAAEQLFTEGFGFDLPAQWNVPDLNGGSGGNWYAQDMGFGAASNSNSNSNGGAAGGTMQNQWGQWGMGNGQGLLQWLDLPALEFDPSFGLGQNQQS